MTNGTNKISKLCCPECKTNIPLDSGNMNNDKYNCPKCRTTIIILKNLTIYSIKEAKIFHYISLFSVLFLLIPFYFIFVEKQSETKIIPISIAIFFFLFFGAQLVRGIKYGVMQVYLGDIYRVQFPRAFNILFISPVLFLILGFFILLTAIYKN